MWKTQSHGPIADWLACADSAPPGEDRSPCPDHKSLCISDQGARRARRECPAAPGEDWASSPVQTSFHYLQLRHPGDNNRVLPGRHRPTRCGNPNPTGRSLIDWGAWSERNPGRIGPHPQFRIPSVSPQLRNPRDENGSPLGRHWPGRCGKSNHTSGR